MASYLGQNNMLDISGSPSVGNPDTSILESISGSVNAEPIQQSGWSNLSDQQKVGIANAASQGGKAGGIGGMLMSGGLQAGLMGAGPVGWAAAGGGLLLSQIEEAQKRKAEHEQALMQAKAQRDQNVLAQLKDLGNNSYRIS